VKKELVIKKVFLAVKTAKNIDQYTKLYRKPKNDSNLRRNR